MKKSRAETAETRKRIVQIAAREFRKNGIEATGVAQIMAIAGLSHGGFYRHFDSKDQLVMEALSATDKNMVRDATAAATESADAMLDVLHDYMTSTYRDNVEDGCPMAAMGSELVRSTSETRHAATRSFRKIAETMAPFMHAQDKEEGLDMALSLLTNMVGALTVARMVDDPVLSDRILAVTQRRITGTVDRNAPPVQKEAAPAQQDAA